MKKIILILSLLYFNQLCAQTAQANYEKCLKSINDQEEKAISSIEDKWYKENPDPNKFVYLACEDHGPKFSCRRHGKQCSGACDCFRNYQNEVNKARDKFQSKKDECQISYKQQVAEENAKAERERKAEEEKRLKEEKEEKEKKEKEEKERLEKEKSANEKSTSKESEKKSDSTISKSSSSSTYVESDYAREMRLRSETQRNIDASEDKAMASALGVTAGAMALAMSKNLDNEDVDDETPIYLKGTIGLGLQEIPVTRNMTYGFNNYTTGATTYNNISESGTTGHFSVNAGLLFAVLNDKFVSFRLSPFFTYGMNAFSDGISGSHMSYGSGAALGIGKKFKVLLKGEYAVRSGNLTEDYAGIGIDAFGYSEYNYSTLKYGAGAFLSFGGHDAFAEISAFRENISFLSDIKAEVYSYEAKVSFTFLALSVQYAPNYPIAGEVKYPSKYEKEKQNLLLFSLYVPFKIFSSY